MWYYQVESLLLWISGFNVIGVHCYVYVSWPSLLTTDVSVVLTNLYFILFFNYVMSYAIKHRLELELEPEILSRIILATICWSYYYVTIQESLEIFGIPTPHTERCHLTDDEVQLYSGYPCSYYSVVRVGTSGTSLLASSWPTKHQGQKTK